MITRALLLLLLLLLAGCEESVEDTVRYSVIERYYDGALYRQFYRKGFERYGRLRTYRVRPGGNGSRGSWVPIGDVELGDQIEGRGMVVDAGTVERNAGGLSFGGPARAALSAVRRRVYVLDIYGTDRVVAIDGESGAVLSKLNLGQGSPIGIAGSSDRSRLYVVHATQRAFNDIPYKPPALAVLTTNPLAIERRFDLPESLMVALADQSLAVSADGASLYVLTASATDGIVRIDLATGAVLNRIPVPASSTAFRTLCLSPDGSVLYALGDARLYAIDTLTQTVSMERLVVHTNAMAIHPNGSRIYIGALSPPEITIFDTVAAAVIGSIPLPQSRSRKGLSVTADGLDLFVNDDLGGRIWRIWLPGRIVDEPLEVPTSGGIMGVGP